MAPNQTTAADIEALKNLMYGEARDAKYYADLLRSRNALKSSALFKRLSDEEAGHLKRLQAEYFIVTGSYYFPCVAMLEIPGNYLDALREHFLGENAGAKTYLDSAAAASNPRLSAIYKEISSDESRHAENLAGLISDYICSI